MRRANQRSLVNRLYRACARHHEAASSATWSIVARTTTKQWRLVVKGAKRRTRNEWSCSWSEYIVAKELLTYVGNRRRNIRRCYLNTRKVGGEKARAGGERGMAGGESGDAGGGS